MHEQTVKCPICRRPYKTYSMMAGDQSACGACQSEARRACERPDTDEERRRRREYFNR